MTDMEVLRRAYERENDSRDNRPQMLRSWEAYSVGASRGDINRLLDEGMIIIAMKADGFTRYKLSEKGRGFVAAMSMERVQRRIPATDLLSAMSLVVGWEDLKASIAMTIERRRRTNFLLEGPPACGKSLIIEGVRSAVPTAYIAFGSRTSASGLSQALFENQPSVLLMDEADKMHHDCYSVMLGLMEGGELLNNIVKMASKRAEVDAAETLPGVSSALRELFDDKAPPQKPAEGKRGQPAPAKPPEDIGLGRFWGETGRLGITEEQVHALLEVKSVNDWVRGGRTLLQALVILRNAVARPPQAPDAPAEPEEESPTSDSLAGFQSWGEVAAAVHDLGVKPDKVFARAAAQLGKKVERWTDMGTDYHFAYTLVQQIAAGG